MYASKLARKASGRQWCLLHRGQCMYVQKISLQQSRVSVTFLERLSVYNQHANHQFKMLDFITHNWKSIDDIFNKTMPYVPWLYQESIFRSSAMQLFNSARSKVYELGLTFVCTERLFTDSFSRKWCLNSVSQYLCIHVYPYCVVTLLQYSRRRVQAERAESALPDCMLFTCLIVKV